MLSEGIGYVHGNLGKDWERKEVNVKGSTKVVWESALAYQPKKDDETVWVNLTVWPSQDGSDGEGTLLLVEVAKEPLRSSTALSSALSTLLGKAKLGRRGR